MCLPRLQAGLFSAVTSAFIIEVSPQLKPDQNEEAATLLRVLVYQADHTAFGDNIPIVPQQWTGPPRVMVLVQAILFGSLATSLFSAFLAMLGKQWLNRYASTDMRGTAIERSQNRQRKLDGIITWYFDHVMESLPLMLQIALLLLGLALSRYLWEVNIVVACVVLGVTSLGVIFYIFIVIAGTAWESCPYQTPPARILRYTFHCIYLYTPRPIHFAISNLIKVSWCCQLPGGWWSSLKQPWYSMANLITSLTSIALLPVALLVDVSRLVPEIVQALLQDHPTGTSPPLHVLDQQTTALDLQCILWILQTSLDKAVHLSTLKHLEQLMSSPTNFDSTLVAYCFDVFISCINVNGCEVVVVQGFGELARVSALCLFQTISHLWVMDPASRTLRDVRQHYNSIFPANIVFHGHQFSHTMNAIHKVFIKSVEHHHFKWGHYVSPSDEHTLVAHTLLKLAQFGYQQMGKAKVPRLILRFALHSLSLDPLPPSPVIADCLLIIAIDLDCDISNTEAVILDERSVLHSMNYHHSDLEVVHKWSKL